MQTQVKLHNFVSFHFTSAFKRFIRSSKFVSTFVFVRNDFFFRRYSKQSHRSLQYDVDNLNWYIGFVH